ncbi:MAG TPA: helix-turn-helix transcriptional regulator, partial [Actinomycetota bacterium]|nr:helix-turn-helix transcriptional regulator [Actinomycetota bacterium]
MSVRVDGLVFGQRLRQLRKARGLTLDALGERVGKAASFLSLIENGKREARLSLIEDLASALGVAPAELMTAEPLSRRAKLEVDLLRAQEDPLYAGLGLPPLKPSRQVPPEFMEHVLALFGALKAAGSGADAPVRPGPEAPTNGDLAYVARRANAALRAEMRARDNYFPEIERA